MKLKHMLTRLAKTDPSLRKHIQAIIEVLGHDEDAFLYEELPAQTTQPEVREALYRFRDLSVEKRAQKPLWAWLLGTGTPPWKISGEDSQYVDESLVPGQMCSNCEYLYYKPTNDTYVCSQIRPYVRPEGWCNRWIKASGKKKQDRGDIP